MKSLLTVKQVAEFLNAKTSTVYAWAEQAKIPCYKVNGSLRFAETEILKWVSVCKKEDQSVKIVSGRRPEKGGF